MLLILLSVMVNWHITHLALLTGCISHRMYPFWTWKHVEQVSY